MVCSCCPVPSYNTVRIMVSATVALLFGSVYASQRVPENEADMNSRVTSIFITFIFLGKGIRDCAFPLLTLCFSPFYFICSCQLVQHGAPRI
jgi:hypothetical protein